MNLTSLQDVLDVPDDADFAQLVAELPEMLTAMRASAKEEGHIGFAWPIRWRRDGGPSTITSHYPDAAVTRTI